MDTLEPDPKLGHIDQMPVVGGGAASATSVLVWVLRGLFGAALIVSLLSFGDWCRRRRPHSLASMDTHAYPTDTVADTQNGSHMPQNEVQPSGLFSLDKAKLETIELLSDVPRGAGAPEVPTKKSPQQHS